jgi:tetratricopeptide (TPR) repeat protein
MRRLRFLLVLGLAAAAAPQLVHAQPGDWGVKRDPFDKGTVARYKSILANNPHDGTALAKLLDMYRRFRTVDLLKEEYGKALEKDAGSWSALVVMGRLQKMTGDDQRALEFFQKAVAKKDSDALSWIAIGELHKAATPTRTRASRTRRRSRSRRRRT